MEQQTHEAGGAWDCVPQTGLGAALQATAACVLSRTARHSRAQMSPFSQARARRRRPSHLHVHVAVLERGKGVVATLALPRGAAVRGALEVVSAVHAQV